LEFFKRFTELHHDNESTIEVKESVSKSAKESKTNVAAAGLGWWPTPHLLFFSACCSVVVQWLAPLTKSRI
jgi:hypothetical protein